MASYGDLTEGEQATWNEYTNLRQISDWPGFDDAQRKRKEDSRAWLEERRALLWHDLNDDPVDHEENKANKRAQRYEFLKDANLNSGAPKHEVRLPCPGGATDLEKVYIEEREVYLAFGSTTDEQKARKQANVDWLVVQRKKVWHLGEDEGWDENNRDERYDALCVASTHGSAYESWDKAHNKWGVPYSDDDDSGGSTRSKMKAWLDKYLGVHENPDGSNKGHEQPSKWQERVYGDDGVPWCACYAVCCAWDAGISGSGTAGVYNNTQLAKQGQGIYKGYTTDPSKLHAGDHAFIGSDHTGVIYEAGSSVTVEGNTSNSGSQYNGGVVVKKNRGYGYWTGFGIVRGD